MNKYRERFIQNAEDFDSIMTEMLAEFESIQVRCEELERERVRAISEIKEIATDLRYSDHIRLGLNKALNILQEPK